MWNDHLEPFDEIARSDRARVLCYLDESIILAYQRFTIKQAVRMVIAQCDLVDVLI